MRKLIGYAALLIVVTCQGCKTTAFEREDELVAFLQHQCSDCLPQEGYVLILLEDMCSTCQKNDLEKLKDKAVNSKNHVVIITTAKEHNLLLTGTENISVIYSPLKTIQASGITQASSLAFRFRGGELVYWNYINDDSIVKIIQML